MAEASEPSTRFSAIAELLGWTKLTVSLAPILKLFQLTARFWVDWLTFKVLPAWPMVAWPAVTWPPVGSALACSENRDRAAATMVEAATRLRPLPLALAVSGATTQAFCAWFQTR